MDRSVLLALYDKYQRIDIQHPELFKEVAGGVVRFLGSPERPGSNFIGYSRLSEGRLDRAIKEQISYYSRLRRSFEWKVFEHDSPPDLRLRLLQHGFTPGEREAVMVRSLGRNCPSIDTAIDVRKVTTADQIQVMINLLQEVWQIDFHWLAKLLLKDFRKRPDYVTIYIAYVGSVPASVGWIQFPKNSQFATLWGGTTKPEYRGQGLYRAVLAARTQEAINRGYAFLAAEISQQKKASSEVNGFQLLTYTHPCYWRLPKKK